MRPDEIEGKCHPTFEAEGRDACRVRAPWQQIADLLQELGDLLGDEAEGDAATEHKEIGDE